MKNNRWSRKLTAVLLALCLLMGSALCAGAEEPAETAAEQDTADAAVVADLSAAEAEEPVLLVSVNGDEIWSNNENIQGLINYYLSFYSSYGYDTADPDLNAYLRAQGLSWAIDSALYAQKAAELQVPEMTDEQKAEAEAQAKAEWEKAVTYYTENLSSLTEESTDEEKAEARVNALSYIESNMGYTEDTYVAEYLETAREPSMRENVQKAVLGEFEVTEEEITNYFNQLVENDRSTYENNVPMYEYNTQYMGSNSYYVPEGYRGITHILLKVDQELLDNYTSLAARLEEQGQEEEKTEEPAEAGEAAAETGETAEAAETAVTAEDAAETAAPAEENAEAAAEAEETATPEPTAEPVTQEMVDAAKQAVMDSVQSQVDEIMAKLDAGAAFADLIADYGTDPGMKDPARVAEGYAVHKDSILWDPVFTAGAMALEKVGDVSEPLLGSHGVHILYYNRDIPAGAVEMTEEIKDQLKEELTSEKRNAAITEMLEGWKKDAEIVYTEQGQAILDAANALEESEESEESGESVETTEATEEALTDDKQ